MFALLCLEVTNVLLFVTLPQLCHRKTDCGSLLAMLSYIMLLGEALYVTDILYLPAG